MFLNLFRYYIQKYQLLLLAVTCSILFFTTAYFYVQFSSPPSGDEPHFLIISQTLLKYHSLNVMLDYNHADYRLFYPLYIAPHVAHNASGQLLPLHSIGGPVLWSIPYYFLGRLGAVFFISFLSLLTILNIYKILLVMHISKKTSFIVSLAYAVASPLYIYSHLTFIEPIAAYICIYLLRKLFQKHINTTDLLCCSVFLGVLPWVHIRFAFFEAVFFFALLCKMYEQNKLNNIKYYVYYLLPVTILFILFEIYNYKVWGTFNPTANEIGDIHGDSEPFVVAPFQGILGVFFDQEYGLIVNFPMFIFLFSGVALALQQKYMRYNLLMLILSIPYILLFTSFKKWYGGWCPPARFILVLLPLYSFYLAYALQRMNNLLSSLVLSMALLYGFVYNILATQPLLRDFNSGSGRNRALDEIQVFHHRLTDFFPSLFLPHQTLLFAIWIVSCAALSMLMMRYRTRGNCKKSGTIHA